MKGTVLVVDDDRAMTKTICAILRKCGWETLQAFNGQEAVTAATRGSLSAVLMDVMMPGMNGVEAYRLIRDLQPATPVILMTAHATQELLQQAMREGVITVLSKPIHWPELMALLEGLSDPRRGVLLVDDDATHLALLADVLQAEGISVRQADSLLEALSSLRQHKARVVLLELNLSYVTAEDAVLAIRDVSPAVALVLCSAHVPMTEVPLTLPTCVHATLQKPFPPQRLLEILDDLPAG